MQRKPKKLTQGPFDLLVIGGGITGAWTAYDAARRGLKVALVDKGDWGSGTSQSSSKMIHGGLRYLENYEFGLVRHSLGERRLLSRIGPHRVFPVRFAMPSYKTDAVPRWQFKAGLMLYDWLAGSGQPVAKHESLSRKRFAERYPYITDDGLRGGFTYGDCQEDDARFTLEVVAGAQRMGATVINHAPAEELRRAGQRVVGAVVRDRFSGELVDVSAKVTVNAAGPWAEELVPGERANRITRLVKGVHLLMPPLPGPDGLFITNPEDGRVVFMIPWYGRTILGTTDSDYQGNADDLVVTDDEQAYLLRIADRALGHGFWSASDVLGRYSGVRTLRNETEENASKLSREWELDEPLENLLMPIGGKYTSARADAAKIVERVFQRLKQADPGCTTGRRPMPWAPLGDFDAWRKRQCDRGLALGLDAECADWAALRFGVKIRHYHRLLGKRPELATRITPELPFTRAEVLHAVNYEMAQTAQDVLRRRIPLMLFSQQSAAITESCVQLLEQEFDWRDERLELHWQ